MGKKHLLDWHIEHTPSDEEEYERGCLFIFAVVIFFWILIEIGS